MTDTLRRPGRRTRRAHETEGTPEKPLGRPSDAPVPPGEQSRGDEAETDQYPNYGYRPDNTFVGFVLVLSNVVVFCCLVVLVFGAPNLLSGGAAILRRDGEYIGVLREWLLWCYQACCNATILRIAHSSIRPFWGMVGFISPIVRHRHRQQLIHRQMHVHIL